MIVELLKQLSRHRIPSRPYVPGEANITPTSSPSTNPTNVPTRLPTLIPNRAPTVTPQPVHCAIILQTQPSNRLLYHPLSHQHFPQIRQLYRQTLPVVNPHELQPRCLQHLRYAYTNFSSKCIVHTNTNRAYHGSHIIKLKNY